MDPELLIPNLVPTHCAKIGIIQLSELTHGKALGGGAFGTVVEGTWTPSNGNGTIIPVAIKLLKDTAGANASQELLKEAFMMASTDHPNLVKLLGTCMTSPIQLVTELMPLGNLRDYAKNNRDTIGSRNMLFWCVQIAKGMEYLESRRLVHRDLAARNVLVQSRTSVKITDFGLARLLDFNAEGYRIHGMMPIRWSAIECFTECIFTHKSDVWAFGVTIWELLTFGDRPYKTFKDSNFPKILLNKTRLDSPRNCKPKLFKILKKTWIADPSARPSFQKLVEEFLHTLEDPSKYLDIPVEIASTTSQILHVSEEADDDEEEIRQFYCQIKSGYGGVQEDHTLYQYYSYGINLNPKNGYLPTVPTSLGLKLEELIPSPNQRMMWRQLPMVISSGILSTLSENDKQLQEAIFEIITSETAYLKSLNTFISLFYKNDELYKSINEITRQKLFGNIKEIRDCSLSLLSDLLDKWEDSKIGYVTEIVEILSRNTTKFPAYKEYCRNIPYQRRTLKFLIRSREQFLTAFCLVENDERCQGLSFDSFSLLPMQRITRYPLLINVVQDKMDGEVKDRCEVCRSHHEQLVRDCDDAIRESLEELVTIEMEESLQFPYGWEKPKDLGKFIIKTEFIERKDLFDTSAKTSSSWFPTTLREIKPTYWLLLFKNRLFITRRNFIQKFEHVDDCNPMNLTFIKMQNVFGASKNLFIIHFKQKYSAYFLSSKSISDVEIWSDKLNELKLLHGSNSAHKVPEHENNGDESSRELINHSVIGVVPETVAQTLNNSLKRVRSILPWSQIEPVLSSGILSTFSENDIKLQEAIYDLIISEIFYLRSLKELITDYFENDELREKITPTNWKRLVGNIKEVRECSIEFLTNLLDMWNDSGCIKEITALASLFLIFAAERFYVYVEYWGSIPLRNLVVNSLKREFAEMVCLREEHGKIRSSLDSLIILPRERMIRYPALFNAIIVWVEEGEDKEKCREAHTQLESLVRLCNMTVSNNVENVEAHTFEGNVWGTFVMKDALLMKDLPFDSGRGSWLMKPFRSSKQSGTYWLLLFTERIVIGKENEDGKFEVIDNEDPSNAHLVALYGMELCVLYFNSKESVYFFTMNWKSLDGKCFDKWASGLEKVSKNITAVQAKQ